MPPHCDSMDGPVVTAASKALEQENVRLILPFVPKEGEQEVVNAFEQVMPVRSLSPAAREVADRHFFETVVRVHREGEGATFTGLKPAGLDVGPVIPVAERAIESGDPEELDTVLSEAVRHQVRDRLQRVLALKAHANGDVEQNREYVEGMLGLQVWAHSLYLATLAQPHEHGHAHGHEH